MHDYEVLLQLKLFYDSICVRDYEFLKKNSHFRIKSAAINPPYSIFQTESFKWTKARNDLYLATQFLQPDNKHVSLSEQALGAGFELPM